MIAAAAQRVAKGNPDSRDSDSPLSQARFMFETAKNPCRCSGARLPSFYRLDAYFSRLPP